MSGYLLVQVKLQVIENEDGTTSKIFPPDTYDLILGTPGIKFFINMDKLLIFCDCGKLIDAILRHHIPAGAA
ncbi:MAG: hypothetical protein VXW06_01805, partial [Pseudomonadota bacterium]|nr:hypothetical protein [Pseudomonadota bacterium]